MRLILLLLLFPAFSFSQTLRITNDNQNNISSADSLWFTPDEYFNYSLGHLNFQEVLNNGGFLIEKSQHPFLSEKFDGLNGDDAILSATTGLNIYSRFYDSYLGESHPLIDVSALRAAASPLLASGTVPIFLINHRYYSLKPTALYDGLFTTNIDSTVLYDNPARTSSPFLQQRLFIGGPYTQSNAYHTTGEVTFSIPPDFIVTDQPSSYLFIDFGDGSGYQFVTLGQKKTINYTNSGLKTIRIKQGNMECTSQFNFTRDLVFEGSTVSEATNEAFRSSVSGATTYTQLGCDGVLNKPVLIVEGLAIEADYSGQEIFNILNNPSSNYLLTRLRELNYDIIVVKFSNNNASIFSNAGVLENVINDVNQQKTGSDKLDIIGLSMGGLIVKYCLKDMEDRSLNHNVNNYFSYDAPHQGAYVPIGLQLLLNAASRAVKDIRKDELVSKVLGVLNSTAAKQLLQVSYNNTERAVFAASYNQKGYPANCSKFAIANGRGDGVGLGYAAGSPLMDFYAEIKAGFLGRVLKHTQQLWTVNNTSYADVCYLSNKGFAAILGLKGLKSTSLRVSYTGLIPHETVPGSTAAIVSTYGEGLSEGFKQSGDNNPDLNLFGRLVTTFVPTVSALDLNNQNYTQDNSYISRNPFFNIQANNVVANHTTPFDDIVFNTGSSGEHLEINMQIADFIMQKIHGSIPTISCTSGCITNPPGFITTLPNTACREHDVTMTNYPPGVNIQWTVPAGVKLLSGQGTNKIRINSNKAGINNLSVSITKPNCTAVIYNVPVNIQQAVIGKPTYMYGELPNVCRYGVHVYSIDPVPGAVSYRWTTNWGEMLTPPTGTQISIDFSTTDGPNFEPFQLSVYAENECGEGEPLVRNGFLVNCHSRWVAYPNPANNEVFLTPDLGDQRSASLETAKKKTTADKVKINCDVSVFNDKGQLLKHVKSGDANAGIQINVSDMPNGTYFLHVKEGTKIIKKQLIVQH